jgi:hypothetical protein
MSASERKADIPSNPVGDGGAAGVVIASAAVSFPHPNESLMLPVLDLDPMLRPCRSDRAGRNVSRPGSPQKIRFQRLLLMIANPNASRVGWDPLDFVNNLNTELEKRGITDPKERMQTIYSSPTGRPTARSATRRPTTT